MTRNGFSSNYGTNPYDGDNLLVSLKGCFEPNFEGYRLEAKKFIQMQYTAVKLILNTNKKLLIAIKSALLEKRLLLRSDLELLIRDMARLRKIIAI